MRDPGSPAPVPMPVYLRIVTALLVGVVLFLLTNGLRSNNLLLVFAALAVPVGLLLIQNSRQWFMLTLGFFYSDLYIPGFPRSLDLFHASAIALIPILVGTSLIKRQRFGHHRGLKVLAACFMAVMLLTIQQRGFGISALGGTTWGGAHYVYMGLSFSLLIFGDALPLEQRHWKHLLLLMFLLGLLPAAAETIFLLSHGKIVLPFYLIRQGGGVAEGNIDALLGYQEAVFRLKTSKNAVLLLVLVLMLLPHRGTYRRWIWIAGMLSAVLVGLSGHRGTLFVLLAMFPLLVYFTYNRIPFRILLGYGGLVLVAMIVLALWGRHLPLAIQRVTSWVPFSDIDYVARQSAASTLGGRFETWRTLVQDYLPRYWFLGRGFAFSAGDLSLVRPSAPAPVAYIITNNYHNGILVLLVNLGVGGFFFGYGFLVFGFMRHRRLLHGPWASETLGRYHRVLFTFYTLVVLLQTAVGCGDWITQPVILMTMLEGMVVTNRRMLSAGEKEEGS